MNIDQSIEKICDILEDSSYVVFLGGAGVSTESGIPDFRSKGGLYHKKQKRFAAFRPEYLLSSECLRKKPEVFFEYYRVRNKFISSKPLLNIFHIAEVHTGIVIGIEEEAFVVIESHTYISCRINVICICYHYIFFVRSIS